MGLPLDAVWEKASPVLLKIVPKTERDISVLLSGVSARCKNMAQKGKAGLEGKL